MLDIFYYQLKFLEILADLLALILSCGPGGDIAIHISFLVPYPGTAIHLHLGVAEDVGIGIVFIISITATKDVATQHTALDMHQGVAVYSAIGTTAIDVVPYVWHGISLIIERDGMGSIGVGDMNDGVAVDSSHLVVLLSLLFEKTLAAAIYRTEDVATDDIHQGTIVFSLVWNNVIDFSIYGIYFSMAQWLAAVVWLITCRSYICHISTAINLTIYLGIIRYLNHGIAVDTSYVGERSGISCLWCNTGSTTEYVAIDFSSLYENYRT